MAHANRNASQPSFGEMIAPQVAVRSFVVGGVEFGGIFLLDPRSLMNSMTVPTNKICHVIEIFSRSARPTHTATIIAPSVIDHLAIAVSARTARPRKNPENLLSRRARIGAKTRLLVNDGQLNSLRHAPFFVTRLSAPMPMALLSKNAAQVVRLLRRATPARNPSHWTQDKNSD